MNIDKVQYSREDDRVRSSGDDGAHEVLAIFRALVRGKLIIFSCLIVSGVIAGLGAWLVPGRYKADATVLVQPVSDLASPTSSTAQIPPEVVRSQLEVVRSPSVISRVIAKLKIMDDAEFAPARAMGQRGADARRAIVISNVQKRLKVDNDGRSVTIHIGFEANSPEKSQRIVDEFAGEYIRAANDLKNRAVALTASRLERRLANLRSEAMRAEDAAEDYRRSVGLVQLSAAGEDDDRLGNTTYVSRLLDQFSKQAAEISAAAEQAQARAQVAGSDMGRTGGVNTPEVLASPVVAALQQRDAEFATTEASLAARYTKEYPPLVQVRAQRAKLRDALLAVRQNIKRSLDLQASGARVAYRAAATRASALEGLVSQQATAAVRYRQLRRDAATKRKIYEDLADRVGTISERSLLQLPDAVLVSPAPLPIKESWPNRPVFFALGCLLGLLIGCVAAVLVGIRRTYRQS